jgi:hypothetical protein
MVAGMSRPVSLIHREDLARKLIDAPLPKDVRLTGSHSKAGIPRAAIGENSPM